MVEIDPQYADTAAFCARYGYPMEQSANTIIVGSKKEPKRHCACVVRATRRVDVNHTVRKLLGVSRLSFADPEETRADRHDAGASPARPARRSAHLRGRGADALP
jgi:prolyl-tRNA editing enzyme YbaK/EbsC (Cys-tRNA(Pro) deacylase)